MIDWTKVKRPKGVTVIAIDTTYITLRKPNDVFVERLIMTYRGHNVQIHRHNRCDDYYLVFIDDEVPKMLHPDLVDFYIGLNT